MSRVMMAIVNPASANGTTAKKWPEIQKMAKQLGLELHASFTEGPGDATRLTRQALKDGYTEIVVVGGDGSVNEVANGFFSEEGTPLNPNASMGILARGTGCDFIKTMRIPREQEAAICTLLQGTPRRIDVGRCEFTTHNGTRDTRYFVNIADLGIGGATVKRVNESSKRFGGFWSFLYGSLATVMAYQNKDIEVSIDGQPSFQLRSNAVIVANGKYFGGGMKIAPQAKPDDGEFHVLVMGDLKRSEIFGNFVRIYKGSHTAHPKVQAFRAKTVHVRSEEEYLLDIDGEQPGKADATFAVVPSALQVIA